MASECLLVFSMMIFISQQAKLTPSLCDFRHSLITDTPYGIDKVEESKAHGYTSCVSGHIFLVVMKDP